MIPIEIGQIRVSKNKPFLSPYIKAESNGTVEAFGFLTHPTHKHFIVICEEYLSITSSNEKFYIVYILTTKGIDNGYDSIKAKEEWFSEKSIIKPESHISRDKFLIFARDIQENALYGNFDLIEFEKELI